MEIKYQYNWHDYIMEYVLPTLVVILLILIIFLIIGTFIGIAFGYIKDDNESLKDKQSKDEEPKDDKNENKEEVRSEYEVIMEDRPFLVNLKTQEVILPHMLLKDENLNRAILENIEKDMISEMNVEKIIEEQLEQYKYYPSAKLFKEYNVDEFDTYINPDCLPFNYLLSGKIIDTDYLLIHHTELTDRNNDEKFIKIFNGFNNYLEVKKNVDHLLLTEEEYNKYKQYLEQLREIKIKTKVNEYYEKSPSQHHTDHLIQLEKEINNIKNL